MKKTIEIIEELKEFEQKHIQIFENKKRKAEEFLKKTRLNLIEKLDEEKNQLLKDQKEKIGLKEKQAEKRSSKEITKIQQKSRKLDSLYKKNKKTALEAALKSY